MILISTNGNAGINMLYPAFFKLRNGKEIPVVDWSQYQKLAPIFVVCNFLISALLICTNYFSDTEYFEGLDNLTSVLLMVYVISRLKFGRHVIKLKISTEIVQKIAPKIVWLDYTTMGIMFILVGYFGALKSNSDMFMKSIFIFMQCFYLIYAALPFLNFLSFSKKIT